MAQQIININSADFVPMPNMLLIEPVIPDNEVKTESGLVISFNNTLIDKRPCSGNVIACGKNDVGLTVNDFIVFPSTDGIDCKFNDGNYILLKCSSVIGYKNRA